MTAKVVHFAVAVLAPGRDEPGILSTLSKILADLGCNAADVFSKPLSGHCAAMLTAQGPSGMEDAELFATLDREFRLHRWEFALWPLVATLPATKHGPVFIVGLSGPDQEGIVSRVTALLARSSANVLSFDSDLTSRRSTYVVRIRAALPVANYDSREAETTRRVGLEMDMHELASQLGLECEVRWE